MTAELIHVDFRNRKVNGRQPERQPGAFNPFRDEFFRGFVDVMARVAISAHERGADYQRMIVVMSDGELNQVVFSGDVLSPEEAVESLNRGVDRLLDHLDESVRDL